MDVKAFSKLVEGPSVPPSPQSTSPAQTEVVEMIIKGRVPFTSEQAQAIVDKFSPQAWNLSGTELILKHPRV